MQINRYAEDVAGLDIEASITKAASHSVVKQGYATLQLHGRIGEKIGNIYSNTAAY